MSASIHNTVGFSGPAVKSRSYIKKNKGSMFNASFGDLPDGAIYRDPFGWKTPEGAKERELQKSRWEQFKNEPIAALDGKTVLQKWDELQKKGFSIRETTQEIRKNLDTGDWTLPLDIIPEVFTINPERLPMADMMTRVATQDDEVVATAIVDHPDISWGLETTNDTEGSYEYSDPTWDDDPTFPVEGLGAATRLEDKLILAASNVRTAESTQEQAFVRAMQQEIERAIILGTNHDSGAWDGLENFVSGGSYRGGTTGGAAAVGDPDSASASDYEDATREIIDDAEYQGADPQNLVVVCDFDWHKQVRESLVSRQRYEGNIMEVGAGFRSMTVDDVPVLKSHAIERIGDRSAGTHNQAFTVNMSSTYLAMLQEVSVKPLAKVSPQEQFACDSYGTLVTEDFGAHVRAATVSPT